MYIYLVPVCFWLWSNEVEVDLSVVGMEDELELYLGVTVGTDPLCCRESAMRTYVHLHDWISHTCVQIQMRITRCAVS